MRPVDGLVPYVNNPRTHSKQQLAQLAAAIREFGFLVPVVTDGAGILAGHGRVLAAQQLGLAEVPTIDGSYLTEAQRKAYVIADNKLALNAGWDDELLKIELTGLAEMGFGLDLVGFSDKELGKLGLGGEGAGGDAEEGNYREQYGVIVVCTDEGHQKTVFDHLASLGYTPKVVVT